MTRKHVVVLMILLAGACTTHPAEPQSTTRASLRPPTFMSDVLWPGDRPTLVRAVVDARTVELEDGTLARISLLAAPPACWAPNALTFATTTLLVRVVRVTSVTPGEVNLKLDDGTDYALLAVRQGVLRTQDASGPLADAEMVAAREKRGLWGSPCEALNPAPVPPAKTTPGPAPTPPTKHTPGPPVSTPTTTQAPAPITTTRPAGHVCAVRYRITGRWPNGFQAEVSLRNIGRAAITGWALRWRFSDGQAVTQMWNATSSQSGAVVSAANASYNSVIAPGGSVSIGFNGRPGRNQNTVPRSFTLNGMPCATE